MVFELSDNAQVFHLFGSYDENLNLLEDSLDVKLVARGNSLIVSGSEEEVRAAKEVLEHLINRVKSGHKVTAQDVRYVVRSVREGKKLEELGDSILLNVRGKPIGPRTAGQKEYVDAIKENPLVFGIGPAGTGKTYLAVAMAVAAFKRREVDRIILTRPAVEAGERLGFLPGDIQEKVNPYLRPIYDSLFDILGIETFEKYMQRGLIEVAPLAYMRGRTLESAFVILDEAQNTTPEQMKMFLTRLGLNSKAVVTGDITQIDLPKGIYSGLDQVRVVLKDIPGIKFVYLTDRDVVRHELVSRIIRAYERFDEDAWKEEKSR
ncbi:MAG: PhoH family protein [Candidatus Fermentithermobacillus carboniphilus]|uniref:PhoH-like protein n=1 Tax=Candidatus Fermentithermobacillus carboniphilus TaxID=3085328 RepID=A0AAT9LEV9_9FIRM|nr:MAG: PhoH family protein [Candidatus Fermentithermobacillus carboniphilus]